MSKTEILTNFTEGHIKLGGDDIPVHGKKYTVKYLGININAAMDWDVHVKEVIKKCRFGLIQLYRLRQGDPVVRNMLFNAVVKSHISYGLSSYGP